MARVILVVDDDPDILLTIREILATEGYQVNVARNGQEALTLIDGERPELIVLDLWMPVMDGIEMARELDNRGISIPIIVLTAARRGSQLADDIEANGYISKPFDIDTLLSLVHDLLRDSRDTG